MDYVEEFDKLKTKVLKYILFKKRTEQEVRQKFKEDSGELLDDVREELKELGYINDEFYIQKAVNEFRNLKNMSIKEIEYKQSLGTFVVPKCTRVKELVREYVRIYGHNEISPG